MDNNVTEKKFLGVEGTTRLVQNIKNMLSKALSDKLSYNEQTLAEEQKEQVRKNIGAMSADTPIPSVDDFVTEEYVNEQITQKIEEIILGGAW